MKTLLAMSVRMVAEYNNLSEMQRTIALSGLEEMKDILLKHLPAFDVDAPITLLDLGCATGGNSVDQLKVLTTMIFPRHHIVVFQDDLPETHWNVVHSTAKSWLEDTRVFHACIGRSFYEQLLPRNSVHVCVSNSAVQWSNVWTNVPTTFEQCQHMQDDDDYYRAGVDSFELLVKNALTSLKPGGICYWRFPGEGNSLEDTIDSWAPAVLLAQTLTEVLGLNEAQLTHVMHLPAQWRALRTCRRIVENSAGCKLLHVSCVKLPLQAEPAAKAFLAALYPILMDRAQCKDNVFDRLLEVFSARMLHYEETARLTINIITIAFQKL